jgi:hypothetical protein
MKLIALIALGALCFAQERVVPYKMGQLKPLVGEWRVQGKGGKVEFHYDKTDGMIGRAKADTDNSWRKMMEIRPDADGVGADFYDVNGRVIHYRLDTADGRTIRFTEDHAPAARQRRIIYEKLDPDRLTYRFETGDKVTDRGILAMTTEVRPLSE